MAPRKVGGILFLAISTIAAVTLSAFRERPAAGRKPPAVVRQAVGGGKWESQRRIESLDHRVIEPLGDWHLQLKQHDDGSVAGRITVVGSPVVHQARIEGQISGTDVYGVLVDDNDRQIGTFTGALFKRGASGTYTTADGDVGNWSTEELGDRAIGRLSD